MAPILQTPPSVEWGDHTKKTGKFVKSELNGEFGRSNASTHLPTVPATTICRCQRRRHVSSPHRLNTACQNLALSFYFIPLGVVLICGEQASGSEVKEKSPTDIFLQTEVSREQHGYRNINESPLEYVA